MTADGRVVRVPIRKTRRHCDLCEKYALASRHVPRAVVIRIVLFVVAPRRTVVMNVLCTRHNEYVFVGNAVAIPPTRYTTLPFWSHGGIAAALLFVCTRRV